MQQGIDLSGLRDIHLPPMPSAWPLAWGWWILIAGAVFFCVGLWFLMFRKPRLTARKYALGEIARLSETYRNDSYALAAEISLLLRRIALLKFPRENVAGLYGRKWRLFLESTSKKPVFKGRAGDIVEHVLYLPAELFINDDVRPLVVAAKEWIAEHT